nr:right-handed parallel beta-helix repeat-containing protein [Rubrobacteraceae bacterium]
TRRPLREDERADAGVGPALAVSASHHVIVVDNYFLAGLPGLSIQARDVRVLRNVIGEAGGVWVRDGSRDVCVEDNEIGWGQGPGILLGGLAEDEAPLDWVTGVTSVDIAANSIVSMDDSGIYTGAAQTPDDLAKGLGDVRDVNISRNRIVGCAWRERPASSEVSVVGGIVLNDTSRVLIHENHIAENGEGPACGVFAGACEGLEVTDNTILDNGTALEDTSERPCVEFREMGPGEGENPRIEQDVAFNVFGFEGERPEQTRIVQWGEQTGLNCEFETVIDLPSTVPLVESTLAAFASPAWIEAIDPDGATVDSQQMRDDMNGQPQTLELGGGEISRVVIHADQDELLLLEFCAGEKQQALQGGIVGLFVTGAPSDETGDRDPEERSLLRKGAHAARIHDNVVVTSQGQALMLTGAGPMSVADNSFTSRGIGREPTLPEDLLAAAGQFSAVLQGGACVFVYNLGRAPLLPRAFSMPGSSTNIHSERIYRPAIDTAGLAAFSDRLLADGRVSFHGNQVTLDALSIKQGPVETDNDSPRDGDPGAVVLFSFDDVSLQDNQVTAEVEGGTVFFNAAAVAATVRASGNRFAESPQALYSCVTYGQMNNTSGNQATYCILALGNDVINTPNQILFETDLCANVRSRYGGTDG